jgi:hypothetical protein
LYYYKLLYLNYYSMIKNFTLIALSCLVIIFNNSCTKEVGSQEAGPFSAYYFNGAPGACATPAIAGIYAIARPLDNTNTLTLTVNVTVKGKYSVQTNSLNGVHFEAGGTFATTGPQSITLYGRGTPLKDGNFSYGILGSSSCNFSVSFLVNAPAAVFTYTGAPACTPAIINGSYATGVALGAANYIDLSINVSSLGTYAISTNTADNIFFTASGIFSATGQQVIRLTGIGSPSSSGTYAFTASGGGCPFNINVTNGGGTTSVYSLDCAGAVVAGTYTVGAPLNAGSNTVTIKANVTGAGTYSLSTTANGMTFAASGTFAVGANQNIVLTGSGSPAAANTSSFAIAGGCSFSITAVAPSPAVYNLTCNITPPAGAYVVLNPLTASNKVDVEVNVTTAGGYTITSTTVNGMTFSKTGVFSTTGIQTVTLNGSGTPAGPAGTYNFTVGTAACPFTVNVTAPTSPCSGLVDGKFVMTGQFTLNGISFGASFGSQYQVSIQDGFTQIDVFFPGSNPPTPGTYSIGTVTMHCLYIAGTTAVDWNATSGSVYVSVDGNGDTVVEFCNVNFTGNVIFPAGTITSTGAGKMVF